ncbi:MAG: hypothetical protein L6Q92_13250 [Phycisphaerae bacterium]|nr:hypothetical protein [Phycisphaerae bacterium]
MWHSRKHLYLAMGAWVAAILIGMGMLATSPWGSREVHAPRNESSPGGAMTP